MLARLAPAPSVAEPSDSDNQVQFFRRADEESDQPLAVRAERQGAQCTARIIGAAAVLSRADDDDGIHEAREGLLVLFQPIALLSSTQVVLNLPIGVQEMVLAVWLIVKGFSPQAKAPAPTVAELHPA